MHRVAIALAGVVAVTGCGTAGLSPAMSGVDRTVSQAGTIAPDGTNAPTLEELEGLIPPRLDGNEVAALLTAEDVEGDLGEEPVGEDAADDAAVEGDGTIAAGDEADRQISQRGRRGGIRGGVRSGIRGGVGAGIRGGFRDGIRGGGHRFRDGRFRGDFRGFRGRHHVFFPRHKKFFRHRFFHGGRLFQPFWRSNFLFYPVVHGGTPYYVQYCWNSLTLDWTPCDVIGAVI